MSQTRNEALADEVSSRIADTFAAEARHDAERIAVRVHDSVATLVGSVKSWTEVQDAERAARTVPGIARVDNQLTLLVKPHVEPREIPCVAERFP